jgi:hypothetical protein
MVVVGALLSVGGLALAVTGRGADRGAGAAIALFFLACLLTAPLFAPGRRRGHLRLETVRVGGRPERGVVVPYSGVRTAVVLGATACLALAMLGLVVFADAFADDPGASPWPVRLVGGVGVVFFGVGGFMVARRGWGRRWRVLLTPSAVVIAMGGARTVVPWAAIQQVRATEVTTSVRGATVSEPLVGIDLSDPRAISTGPLERLLLPLNRHLAADITLPIRTLDIDPPLLYEALRYYHQHPEAGPSSPPRTGWRACGVASSPSRPPGRRRGGAPAAGARPARLRAGPRGAPVGPRSGGRARPRSWPAAGPEGRGATAAWW